jgi:quercetin dioxygenase-like cupin family protein
MITKKENAVKRQFKGVNFDVLAVGDKTMVTKMNFEEGNKVPFHWHPNEQCGYIVSGQYLLNIEGETDILTHGDSYVIPENIVHALEVIEKGTIIDFFTPPRKDYL